MATIFKVRMEKPGFYNGKYGKFEIPFLHDKFINIVPQYIIRCRIATFRGYVFQEKLILSIFHKKIMI